MSKEVQMYQRMATQHQEHGDQYAVRSHEYEGELSLLYSALAESHHAVAKEYRKLGGTPWGDDDDQPEA